MYNVRASSYKSLRAVMALLLASLVILPMSTYAQSVSSPMAIPSVQVTNYPEIDGFVTALYAAPDGSIYAGGNIQSVDPQSSSSSYSTIDATTGELTRNNLPFVATIDDVVSDGDGGYFIAGSKSTSLLDNPIPAVMHLLADNTLDTNFNITFDQMVRDIDFSVSDQTLYAVGDFGQIETSDGITNQDYFAAIDVTAGTVTNLNPDTDLSIDKVLVDEESDVLYLSGEFTFLHNSSTQINRLHIASISTNTGAVSAFDPSIDGHLYDIALDSTRDILYAVGDFNYAHMSTTPIQRSNAAGFDVATSAITSFADDLDIEGTFIRDVEVDQARNMIYLAGDFSIITNTTNTYYRDGVAAVSGDSPVVSSFDAGILNGDIVKLEYSSSRDELFVSGDFRSVVQSQQFIARTNMASYDGATGRLTDFDPIITNFFATNAFTLNSDSDEIFIGAAAAGGTRRNGLVHILADGTLDPNFNPDVDGLVRDFAYDSQNNILYVAGRFQYAQVSSSPLIRFNLLAIDLDTGDVTDFNVGTNRDVTSIAIDSLNHTLYAGGEFTEIQDNNGVSIRNRVVAIDVNTNTITGFNPSVDGEVRDVLLDTASNRLIVAGEFNNINTLTTPVARPYLAAFDLMTSVVTSFNPEPDDAVNALSLDPVRNTLYVGGDFDNVNVSSGNTQRSVFAAFDATSGIVKSWDPDVDGNDALSVIYDPIDDVVYLCGLFGRINISGANLQRYGVGAVDALTGLDEGLNVEFLGNATSVAFDLVHQRMYIGGIYFFDNTGPTPTYEGGLAVFGTPFVEPTTTTVTTSTTLPSVTNTTGSTGISTTLPVNPQNTEVTTSRPSGGVTTTLPKVQETGVTTTTSQTHTTVTTHKRGRASSDDDTIALPKLVKKKQPWLIFGDLSLTGSNIWDSVIFALFIITVGTLIYLIQRERKLDILKG